jgi:hypothetical protein
MPLLTQYRTFFVSPFGEASGSTYNQAPAYPNVLVLEPWVYSW